MHDVSITYPSYLAIDSDSRAGAGWRDELERRGERVIYWLTIKKAGKKGFT